MSCFIILYLQAIFDLFYDEVRGRDSPGLAAMKSFLKCNQVNAKEIRKNFYAADLFLDKVLDSILMEAAVTKFGAEVINHPKEVEKEIGKRSYW